MPIVEHTNFYACGGKRFEFKPGDFQSKVEARIRADKYRLSQLKIDNMEKQYE